jgi:VWFA-related protein
MKRLVKIFVATSLVVFAWPAMAAKTLSIDQMEQLLAQLQGTPDGKAAGELGEVQLTERVSPARLARWEAKFPGSRTREALMQLADMSAFLDPPASDVVLKPRPDIETQKRILRMAVKYVENTMSRLPDFFATRETTHFEDTLSQHQAYSVRASPAAARSVSEPLGAIDLTSPSVATLTVFNALHSTGAYNRTVAYRGGHEVLEEDGNEPEKEPALGLTTHGEFGPILAQILSDALHGQLSFLRWEQSASGPEAVFHYTVTANASHFRVGIASGDHVDRVHPGYHGEIEIDPETGEFLRLSEVAEMTPPYQAMSAAIAVEYTPVTIAGQSYICPARAVAFSKIPVPTLGAPDQSTWPVHAELNDIAFSQYHEFRTEARIVANPSESSDSNAAGGDGTATPESSAGVAAPGPSSLAAAATASPGQPAAETAANSPSNASAAPIAESPAARALNPTAGSSADAMVPPDSSTEAKPVTETAAAATPAAPASTAFNVPVAGPVQSRLEPDLKVNSRLVLVDVVVRKGDRPVAGLQQSDFALYEDGVPQTIRNFTPHFADRTTAVAQPPSLPPDTWTNLPVAQATDSVTVLLLDGLNTEAQDELYVRREMIRHLKTLPPGRRIAIFTLGSRLRMLQGFTTDSNLLLASLAGKNASPPESLLKTADQTNRERAEEDRISTELLRSGSNTIEGRDTPQLIDNLSDFMSKADTAQTGTRVALTLEALQELARYLTGIPGRKNLVWLSGSFPLQFFATVRSLYSGSPTVETDNFEDQLRTTADMLAAARVAVYPVDARGVLAQPMLTADQQGDFLNGNAGRSGNNLGNQRFRNDMQIFQLQTEGEQGSMDILAKETGGRAVYSSNGLEEGIAAALSDGANFYALAYIPTNKDFNGRPRKIEVRLSRGTYQLSYRQSYYADAAPLPQNIGSQGEQSVFLAAMRQGVPAATQILFSVRAAAPDQQPPSGPVAGENPALKERAARYAIDYTADLHTVDLKLNANGMREGHLAAMAIAYDHDGTPLNWIGNNVPIALDSAAWDLDSHSGFQIRQVLDLPAGAVYLRIGLFDPESGHIGSLEIPLQVMAQPPTTPFASH